LVVINDCFHNDNLYFWGALDIYITPNVYDSLLAAGARKIVSYVLGRLAFELNPTRCDQKAVDSQLNWQAKPCCGIRDSPVRRFQGFMDRI
jgi:hypothetical protein